MPATFKQGDRVKLTNYGVEQGLAPWARKSGNFFGTVTKNQRGIGVQVLRDGVKRSKDYHVAFWDRY